MSETAFCAGCGRRQDLPREYARPQYRCTGCGTLNKLPEPAKGPANHAPTTEAPPEREILLRGTDDDDFNPYSVRGDVPAAKCPACGQAIHERVSICNHCGADLQARKQAQRTFVAIDRTWEIGWPLAKRLALFLFLQAINGAVLIAGTAAGWSAGLSFGGTALVVALQAFLLGTYDRIRLTRNAKGKVALTRTWRYAFVPRPDQAIRWREHEGICVVMNDETEPFDWMIVAWLSLMFVVPGIVFWWLAIRGERYNVALCKDHGFPDTIIFRTLQKQRAEEVVATISEAAMLPILR